MKNKILFGTMLALLLVGSVSFADDDADKKRLLEEYDRMQEEKAKAQPEMTEVVGENGEVFSIPNTGVLFAAPLPLCSKRVQAQDLLLF